MGVCVCVYAIIINPKSLRCSVHVCRPGVGGGAPGPINVVIAGSAGPSPAGIPAHPAHRPSPALSDTEFSR